MIPPRVPARRSPLLALALCGLATVAAEAAAQSQPPPEYRVEVLVVEPAAPRSDAWPADALADFGYAADPRRTARLSDALATTWPAIEALGLPLPRPLSTRIGMQPPDDDGPSLAETVPDPVERPPRWTALSPDPESLLDAERRLTRDGAFLPVARISWLQTAGSPRRPLPVRVHDEVVIRRDAPPEPDPTIDALPSTGALDRASPGPVIDASRRPTPGPDDLDDLDDPGHPVDGQASARSERRPVLRADPRLDGTVALVQRQFLHVEIDLHWREPVERPRQPGAPTAPARAIPEPIGTPATPSIDAPEAGWQVHRLQQSRVIRPERWTWFDSERFGVLVRITELPPLLPLPPPDPPAAANPTDAAPGGEAAAPPTEG